LAATNKDLLKEIELGNFRMDLYHRLSVILIHVPSLVERIEDIPLLAKNFCDEICAEYNIKVKEITNDAVKALQSLPWTGNIRELRNLIERLIILSNQKITEKDVLTFANPSNGNSNGNKEGNDSKIFDYDRFQSFQDYKDYSECKFIKYKLDKNFWNVSKTADEIGIQRSHLYSKIEKFGLKRD